eukprot:NODE_25_length_35605_cov_0.353461.p17 type:complete len:124 gc:universal NODE_25_length_35605_cov_0.353461:4152-4523(+)
MHPSALACESNSTNPYPIESSSPLGLCLVFINAFLKPGKCLKRFSKCMLPVLKFKFLTKTDTQLFDSSTGEIGLSLSSSFFGLSLLLVPTTIVGVLETGFPRVFLNVNFGAHSKYNGNPSNGL